MSAQQRKHPPMAKVIITLANFISFLYSRYTFSLKRMHHNAACLSCGLKHGNKTERLVIIQTKKNAKFSIECQPKSIQIFKNQKKKSYNLSIPLRDR